MLEEIFEDTFADFDTYTRDLNNRQLLVLLQKMKEELNERIMAVQDELEEEEADGDYDDDLDSDDE